MSPGRRCPISMIMAVDQGVICEMTKMVENAVQPGISTDLSSCWIIVPILNDHDDSDDPGPRHDTSIETVEPVFSSKLTVSLTRRRISLSTDVDIRI